MKIKVIFDLPQYVVRLPRAPSIRPHTCPLWLRKMTCSQQPWLKETTSTYKIKYSQNFSDCLCNSQAILVQYWNDYIPWQPSLQRNLTNWYHDKMDTSFQTIFSNYFFLMKTHCVLILLKYVPKGPIYNKTNLGQIMAWHWTGGKPITQLMLA